jgi:hypothetical protein
MMINYQEELLAMLENNELRTLPSQELIDSSERVVKAIWKNKEFESEDRYGGDRYYDSFEIWYYKSKWGTILQKYSENTQLWEELLGIHEGGYNFILSSIFQEDYPVIAEHFLKNNDKLIELFNKTGNKEFYDRLNLDLEKKEDVHKLFLIKNYYHIDKEVIKKYENDDAFVTKLLNKNSSYFTYLNTENKANKEYIKIALRGHYDNFFLLSDENKNRYFKSWATHYISKINLKNVLNLDTEQQSFILSQRHDLLSSAIQNKDRGLYQIAVDCLKKNVEEVINAFDDDSLKVFIKNKENLKTIKPQLEKFVENYKGAGFTKKDNKMMFLLSYDNELTEKLQTNIFYKVSKVIESKQKQDVDWFEYMMKKVLTLYDDKKITNEEAKILTGKVKSCLTIEAMKELRIPKENSFEFVRAKIIGKALQEELPINDSPTKKIKV